jgi:osmotically-inducible protein OsmY
VASKSRFIAGESAKLYHFAVNVHLAAALAVALALAGCAGPQLTEAELSDPGIKARVEERLRAEPNLNIRFISVDAHERVVTISGLVDSLSDRWRVERLVRAVPGIEQVFVNLAFKDQ